MNEQIGNKINDKTYIKLTPFKGWALENFPFIEADFDAITNYQLLCKVIEYLNNVISNQNTVQELGTDLVNAYNSLVDAVNLAIGEFEDSITTDFNTLHDYVYNYFDNLDVQEEINNKLDEMVADGTLSSILNSFLSYKLYSACLSQNTEVGSFNLVEFPNGFTILYDCGYTGQNSAIASFMSEKEITHLDVVIVSHFHADHSGCFEYIARNYCNENTLFFRQMQCDYSRLTLEGANGTAYQQEQTYTNVLTELGFINNSRIPTQNEIVSLLNGTIKLRFLNTNSEFAESYYSAFSDTDDQNYNKSSLNNFSLMCEISAFNKKLLFTGDIETQGQINNETFMQKCDVMQIPHHNWNHNGYYKFFDRISPDITFFNRNTTLTDGFVYWSKYQRQRIGYKPTYYTKGVNVEMNISNADIIILSGILDTTFNIPNTSQQLASFLPFCTNYTTSFFSYATWTIKNVIDMIKECDDKVYTVLVSASGRYTTFNTELQAMTNANVNWILTTNTRGFELQRLSNWDGIIYKFIQDFNYSDTSTYKNNFGAFVSPFNNLSVNENLNIAEGEHATLTNELRFAPTLKCNIRTFIGNNESEYIDYQIILHHKGGGLYNGHDIFFTYDETTEKTFLRDAITQIHITNNVAYADICHAIVYNATENEVTYRNGIILSLNSTTEI